MSHKSGHVIIKRVSLEFSTEVVLSASVELQFPPNTSPDDKMKKIRRVECLLDRLDHDDED
jgi:hypothetical protein